MPLRALWVFTLFQNFSPMTFPFKTKGFGSRRTKRRKDNKKIWTHRCCTLVVARLSSSSKSPKPRFWTLFGLQGALFGDSGDTLSDSFRVPGPKGLGALCARPGVPKPQTVPLKKAFRGSAKTVIRALYYWKGAKGIPRKGVGKKY